MKFSQMAVTALVALLALPLAGCPMYPSTGYTPAPYPYKPPVPVFEHLDGPSLSDAYHDVERWLGSHYPGARLLSVEGPAVGRSGRSGGKGWTFNYAAPSGGEAQPQPYPYPVFTPTPAPVPLPKPTPRPKYVLEPGEQYGPPADETPLIGNNTGGLVTNNAFLVGNDDEPQILPIRKLPPMATPAPGTPRPVTPSYTTRYFAITVDGAGRLLAPEDLAEPPYGAAEPAVLPGSDDPDFLGDRISIMPAPAPQPQGIDFKRTVSLVKLLTAVEDLGYPISPAGVKVSIRNDASRGAVVEIDPQVAVRATTPASYPTYGGYGPEPSDGPYAASANRGPAYGVKCVAPPSQPWPYETSPDGVLYRGSYLFNAYTGELISRPAQI